MSKGKLATGHIGRFVSNLIIVMFSKRRASTFTWRLMEHQKSRQKRQYQTILILTYNGGL